MNTARTLAIAALAMASLPLLAQQAGAPQSGSPDQQPATSAPASPAQSQQQMAPPIAATSPVQLSSVNGELVDKLDTKTAKNGDAVVIKTKENVKTADGTEIPKGSKLVGRVTGVKPIGEGNQNSQVALQFDHVELKGGQNLPIHAEIQSLSTTDSDSAGSSTAMASPGGGTSAPAAAAPSGSMNGSTNATASSAPSQPQTTQAQATTGAEAGPAPGTIVARTGNIAIRTTSVPGVLLATNEPGQQDPRLAQSSGILLGPKHDVHLDSGTKVVMGVAASNAPNAGGGN